MQDAMDRIARYFEAEYAEYDEDLPLLQAYAERTGGPILELGCGSGRALLQLAHGGYDLTGVDISPEMLRLAQVRAAAAGLASRVTLLHGDFENVPLQGPYRFAYCVMNTFLHLDSQGAQVRALKHWREHLSAEGLLLIEIMHPDVAQLGSLDGKMEWQQTWIDEQTGNTVMKFLTRSVDLAEQTQQVNAIYDEIDREGRVSRTVASFSLRYIWRFEAELLLEKAGFTLEALYGDWDTGPFNSESQQMILVARRRG